MRPELATAGANAAHARAVLCRRSGSRPALDRFAATRRAPLENGARRTRVTADHRADDGRPGRRFHTGGAKPSSRQRLPTDNAWTDHPPRRNRGDLLSQRALLRAAGVIYLAPP